MIYFINQSSAINFPALPSANFEEEANKDIIFISFKLFFKENITGNIKIIFKNQKSLDLKILR